MQFTQKAKQHIDSCRFCWMCHHVCPIGNATGLERNTARARALGLSMVARNAIEYTDDVIKNVYECCLCGGCMTDCVTGWDPVMFTKEARLGAALDGKLPEYVMTMLGNIAESGNIYGEKEIADVLKDAIADLPAKADVLFFIVKDGASRTPEKAAKAIELLKKAGVDFTVDKHEKNSCYDMDFLIGAAEETRQAMAATAEAINAIGAKTIVCYDPADAKVFLREYKEYGIDLKANVVTFPAFLAKLIADGKLAPKKGSTEFTFQDPASLARDLEDSESARKVLSACGELREMLLCKEHTMIAGKLIMNEYMPAVIETVAKNRWINAKNIGATTVVTASPSEYYMLNATNDGSVELITIEEAVLRCL